MISRATNITEAEPKALADPKRCALILNKGSGTLQSLWSDSFRDELLGAFIQSGWQPDLKLVDGKEIEASVNDALQNEFDAIISGGGDGTTTSIAQMVKGSGVPLGILPFGTLNLAARGLGTPLEPIEAARSLKPGRYAQIDVLVIDGKVCLCLVVLGFYPRMMRRFAKFHGRHWWIKYWGISKGIMKSYLQTSKMAVTLEAEGREVAKLKTRFIAIVPGDYSDTAGLLPERESMESGRCTIFCSRHASRWQVAKLAARFIAGTVRQDPQLDEYSARSFVMKVKSSKTALATLDGEIMRLSVPIKLDLVPKALTVLKPQVEEEKK